MRACWIWFLPNLVLFWTVVRCQKADFEGFRHNKADHEDHQGTIPARAGSPDGTPMVVGGRNSTPKDCAKMAALFGKKTSDGQIGFVCGGSILNENTVLTAGHCCKPPKSQTPPYEPPYQLYEVGVECSETLDKDEMKQRIRIKSFITHPKFKRPDTENKIYDVCLLKLEKTIQNLGSTVKRMRVPSLVHDWGEEKLKRVRFKVFGWGFDEHGKVQDRLLEAPIKFRDQKRCKEKVIRKWGPGHFKDLQSLCVGGVKKDSCNGDSGGPLVTDDEHEIQVGIVSWGAVTCASGLPGIYMNVTHFLPWLKKASARYHDQLIKNKHKRPKT